MYSGHTLQRLIFQPKIRLKTLPKELIRVFKVVGILTQATQKAILSLNKKSSV